MGSGEEAMRSEGLGYATGAGHFVLQEKMEEAVVNGKMTNFISDILGSKKMRDI